MAFHVRDPETDTLVRSLARRLGVGLTDAVKLAVQNELRREGADLPLRERAARIAESLSGYRRTGKKADKAFFDELSGS